jgi:hypothetical protein
VNILTPDDHNPKPLCTPPKCQRQKETVENRAAKELDACVREQ